MVCEACGGRVDQAKAYYKAIIASVSKYFKGNCAIASKKLCNDFISLGTEAISRGHVGNDFGCANSPSDPSGTFWLQGYSMVHGVYNNSLWMGNYIYPDWDMFQTTHPCGEINCQGGGWCQETVVPLH
ncbi:hypothetical protein Nepgr_021600 [Nepenthes gracilis]|uniref:Uncharacterized protein n=1 Tax=Nepenthes gracilis TaxID=150966 RepID=A0AAD3SZL6_NEPGR|nr:hypothetical protein Nepgr_021600 [Nepenthes gracilis]